MTDGSRRAGSRVIATGIATVFSCAIAACGAVTEPPRDSSTPPRAADARRVWSGSSDAVVFTSGEDGAYIGTYVSDLKGRHRMQVGPRGYDVVAMNDVSYDGTRVLLSASDWPTPNPRYENPRDPEPSHVFLGSLTGGSFEELSAPPGDPPWTGGVLGPGRHTLLNRQDSDSALFLRDDRGASELLMDALPGVDPDEGDEGVLEDVSEDGSWLLYSTGADGFDMHATRMDHPRPGPVLTGGEGAAWSGTGRLSPDGRSFLYIADSATSGDLELWAADRETRQRRRLVAGNRTFISTACWSPDGRHVMYAVRGRGGGDTIFVAHADGSHRREAFRVPAGVARLAWIR